MIGTTDHLSHTAFSKVTVISTAADKTIPQPPSISGLGSRVNVPPDELELACPTGNTDNVFVALEGVATVNSKPIKPGETKRFSGTGRNTLSAISGSGTQDLEITAFYR